MLKSDVSESPGKDQLVQYRKLVGKNTAFLLLLLALLLFAVVVALSIGSYDMSVADGLSGLLRHPVEKAHEIVVWGIRMPRVLGAVVGGAALSISGAVMQSTLKNPLASPFTVGLSSAAGFGAALAIIIIGASPTMGTLNIGFLNLISISAFLCCLAVTAVILAIAHRDATPETMILSGIAMGSLFSAGYMILLYFATTVQLSSVVFWTFGDVGRMNWPGLGILTVVTVAALVFFILNAWNFNAMQAGDEDAKSLGVKVARVRILAMAIASMLTAVVVSLVGVIGFVGLVVPHMVRKITGSDDRWVLPGSILLGALLLLCSDTIARTIISPIILPVGVITSFLGAPMFLYLIIRRKRI